MNLTFTSFLTTVMISSIIVLVMVLLISKIRLNKVVSANVFMGLSLIFLVRLCVPIEFPFTIAIPSDIILPKINDVMESQLQILNRLVSVKQLIICIWFLGSCFFLIQWVKRLYSIYLLKCIFKKSINGSYKDIKISKVDMPISPVVIGLFDPLIVIPDIALTSREKEFILEHERFHVHSLDLWMKYFYEALKVIYWWNPVIWIFRKYFNQIIELKADEFVTNKLNEKDKIRYVETLVKVEKSIEKHAVVSELSGLPKFSSGNDTLLLNRVKNIFYEKKAMDEKLVILISGIIGVYLTSCIIFEPYNAPVDPGQELFQITADNSILKRIGKNSYVIYRDGKRLFEITEEVRIQEYNKLEIVLDK